MVKRIFSTRKMVKVYLEQDDWEDIKRMADKLGISVSRYIRELLDSVLR
jgi:predicted DNA binding CopG/RHH family protein